MDGRPRFVGQAFDSVGGIVCASCLGLDAAFDLALYVGFLCSQSNLKPR